MITIEQYKDIFYTMYSFFSENIYDISFFNFDNIYISKNIINDLPDFGVTDKYDPISGGVILPNEVLDEPVILIDITLNNLVNLSMALFHELVHIYDFKQFADKYTNGNFEKLIDQELFKTLRSYSEFHASAFCELYSIQFLNSIYGACNQDKLISSYIKSLNDYVDTKRNLITNQSFSLYDLLQFLGKLYVLDSYNHVHNMDDSCFYQYLPELFHSNLIYQIQDLYMNFFDDIENQTVLDHLPELNNQLNKLTTVR